MTAPFKQFFAERNMINCFSFGLLLFIFLIMAWLTYDKHQKFLDHRHHIAETALENASAAITATITTKKRILDHFVRNQRHSIIKLINEPDNHEIMDQLQQQLRGFFPDLFTINIANTDNSLHITDFDGFIGNMCIADLRTFRLDNTHLKQTHPNHILYHYDEISTLKYKSQNFLFFASFSLEEIISSLRHSTPSGYNIFIIKQDNDQSLLEVTTDGGRDEIKNRTDFRLTDSELNNITSRRHIPGTHWTLVNSENNALISQHIYSLIIPAFIIFILFSAVILYMRNTLRHNFNLIRSKTNDLLQSNNRITELNNELMKLSMTDQLTGIKNRRYFDEHFNNEWQRCIRSNNIISIIIIDIDHFKNYNDSYGHIEGDNCLIQVASILDSCFNRSNEFVARFGGEEFIAVINGDNESCSYVTDSIHAKLKQADISHRDTDFNRVTVSIGVASLAPNKDTRAITLIERADIALYQAKKNNRNQTVIYDKSILSSM